MKNAFSNEKMITLFLINATKNTSFNFVKMFIKGLNFNSKYKMDKKY